MIKKAQIGLSKIGELERKKEKRNNDAILKVINDNIVDKV